MIKEYWVVFSKHQAGDPEIVDIAESELELEPYLNDESYNIQYFHKEEKYSL